MGKSKLHPLELTVRNVKREGRLMNQSKATPRPFHVRLNDKNRKVSVYNDDMTFVCEAACEDDAELIVRAVNVLDEVIIDLENECKALFNAITKLRQLGATTTEIDGVYLKKSAFLKRVRGENG